jgi:hypothetical protein
MAFKSKIPAEIWTVFAIATIGNVGFSATLPFYAVYLVHRNVSLSIIGAVYLGTGVPHRIFLAGRRSFVLSVFAEPRKRVQRKKE